MDTRDQRGAPGTGPVFTPPAVTPLPADAGLAARIRALRDNPISTLPEAVYAETLHTSRQAGGAVHYLAGPQACRAVLQDDADAWRKSPLILRMLRPILGEAVFTAHGEAWRRQRMSVQPAFMKKRIARFAPVINAAARGAVERLSAPGAVEVHAVMNDTTLQIIEQVLFSDTNRDERALVRAAFERLLKEIGHQRAFDLLPFPEWAPRPMSLGGRKARAVFRNAAQARIRARRAAGEGADDLLSLLLGLRDSQTGAALSDAEIRDTLLTFVAAGHETTALALTWALYCLAQDRGAQARVRAEADAVFTPGAEPDAAQSAELVFTRQVIEEALRLFPPAPVLGRRAVRDTHICGRLVKKGERALIAIYAQHRNPALWDRPALFDPDRWSAQRRPADPFAFLAFGAGPRVCVGAQFAMMEASLILAQIVQALEVSPTGERVEPVMQVTLRPRGGLRLRFQPRA